MAAKTELAIMDHNSGGNSVHAVTKIKISHDINKAIQKLPKGGELKK